MKRFVIAMSDKDFAQLQEIQKYLKAPDLSVTVKQVLRQFHKEKIRPDKIVYCRHCGVNHYVPDTSMFDYREEN